MGESVPPARAGGGLVLLVDDDEGVRLVTTRALERLGFEVLPAASGQEAIDALARARSLRLVLLDLALPGPGARAVLDSVARLQPGARVVAMTGYSREVAERALGRGAFAGFVQKPFDLATLAETLRAILDR